MNAEQKKMMRKWIKALRSGKYRQGKSALKRRSEDHGATYCCLGVLCEVAGIDSEVDPLGTVYDFLIPYSTERRGHTRKNSFPTQPWFEEQTGLPKGEMTTLAEFNDSSFPRYKDFNGIADYLEEKLKGA